MTFDEKTSKTIMEKSNISVSRLDSDINVMGESLFKTNETQNAVELYDGKAGGNPLNSSHLDDSSEVINTPFSSKTTLGEENNFEYNSMHSDNPQKIESKQVSVDNMKKGVSLKTDAELKAEFLNFKGMEYDSDKLFNKLMSLNIEEINELMGNPFFKEFLNLSEDQFEAIKEYTGEAYRSINNGLRNSDFSNTYNNKIVGLLDSVIGNSNGLSESQPLYRATNISALKKSNLGFVFDGLDMSNPNQVFSALKSLQGQSLVDKGFMSTSKGGIVFDGDVQFIIDAKKGLSGIDLSCFSSNPLENEFLLARGTGLKINDVTLKYVDGKPVYTINAEAFNSKPSTKINTSTNSFNQIINSRLDSMKQDIHDYLYTRISKEYPNISFDDFINPVASENLFFKELYQDMPMPFKDEFSFEEFVSQQLKSGDLSDYYKILEISKNV